MRSFQQDQDARLTRMWNKGWTAKRIAEKLGYATRASVSHRAKALGLAPRRSEAITEARQTRIVTVTRVTVEDGPVPTLFRCEMCSGRSSDAAGHELCQARMRAA
jgi:hypothetical protein